MAEEKKQANSLSPGIQNSLGEALGINDPFRGFGTQLSQLSTLFNNLRFYMASNNRQLLSEAYVEQGLLQTIVDVPVDDALRGGYEIKSKQLKPKEIQELQVFVEREDINDNVIGRAMKWTRLYGGGGIVIVTGQDPAAPLDIEAIKKDYYLGFQAADMWELLGNMQNLEEYNPAIHQVADEYYNFYTTRLHGSRVMRMKGMTAPSIIRPRLRGWGFSVVEALIQSINQYLKTKNLTFEVLDEFKVDVYRIEGLTDTLNSGRGTAKIHERVQLANMEKNFNNAITMDKLDEYQQKQLSFTGIAEIMKEVRIQIASDMRMPLNKIFGLSATGFNSGEDDNEVYNSMVESQVRSKCKREIIRVLELCSQKLFGYVPTDLSIEFKSLRVLSSVDEESVKREKFARLFQARQAGEITQKQFIEGCNKANLLEIQIETMTQDLEDEAVAEETEVEEETDPKLKLGET